MAPLSAHAFSFGFVQQSDYSTSEPAGFLQGIWHGLLAPYSLVVDLFTHVEMYAYNNTGWFYNLGFIIGVTGCLPIGWLAALIALAILIL
jgi:hypothetical protein